MMKRGNECEKGVDLLKREKAIIRIRDKKYLKWLKGAVVHHEWEPCESEHSGSCLTEDAVHRMIHSKNKIFKNGEANVNVFNIRNGECRFLI